MLSYLKNENLRINEILDLGTRSISNLLKSTRSTRYSCDSTPEQNGDVNCRNLVQIKRLSFLLV
jgi:hypothetical protein